jgi:hypothetical protein
MARPKAYLFTADGQLIVETDDGDRRAGTRDDRRKVGRKLRIPRFQGQHWIDGGEPPSKQ